LSGIFLEKREGLQIPNAFGTMTESDKNSALLMNLFVFIRISINPKNAIRSASRQAYGQQKHGGSTFVGGEIL
jgi:hypothetical protein